MNNRRLIVILALAVLLCGLLAFRGAEAEEDRWQKEDRENREREDAADNGRPIEFYFTDGIWEGTDFSLIGHLFYGLYQEPELTEYNGMLYSKSPTMDLDGDGSPDIQFSSGSMESGYDASIVHLAGSSIKGTYTWHKKYDESEYYYSAYTPEATVVFYFGEEQPKDSYSISVEGGYATDWKGNRIAQTMPGEVFFVHFDVVEGKYASTHTRTTSSGYELKYFIMPCSDITIAPHYENQIPYTIDMASGFGYVNDLGELSYVEYIEKLSSPDGLLDLDGDGTFDLRKTGEYNSTDDLVGWLFVPLSTGSIRGEYTFQNPGDDWSDKYSPITIRFPENETAVEYFISVSGGEALDEQGNVIDCAEPGTYIYLHRISEQGFNYSTNLENWPSGWCWGGTCRTCMPACDIEFTLKGSEEDDTPVVTPTPTEQSTLTPTEQPVTPVPTEEQKVTEPVTPTLVPTENPGGSDKEKQKESEDSAEKDNNKLLLILIPITVVILGALTAAFVIMNKKKPVKPAQKETIDEGEDDYE